MRREEQEKYKQWRWTHFSLCTTFVYQSLLCMCSNRRGYQPLGVLLSTQSLGESWEQELQIKCSTSHLWRSMDICLFHSCGSQVVLFIFTQSSLASSDLRSCFDQIRKWSGNKIMHASQHCLLVWVLFFGGSQTTSVGWFLAWVSVESLLCPSVHPYLVISVGKVILLILDSLSCHSVGLSAWQH